MIVNDQVVRRNKMTVMPLVGPILVGVLVRSVINIENNISMIDFKH